MARRILVADDSSTIQKVIKIAFARHAIEIVEAGSYIEALAAVGRATPDALIIDASLPGVRGPADFGKLTADARSAPLLLLVGTYEAVDEGALRAAGFQHFLKKPFESADIVALVDRLLGGSLTGAAAAAAHGPAGRGPMGGPVVPPLPGSNDRARHVTVIHTGGFATLNQTLPPVPDEDTQSSAPDEDEAGPGYGDLGDLADPTVPPPPPPQTDGARKGRRAFSGDGDAPPPPPGGTEAPFGRGSFAPDAAGRGTTPPEPPRRGQDTAPGRDPYPPGPPPRRGQDPDAGRDTNPPGPPPRRGQDTDVSRDTNPPAPPRRGQDTDVSRDTNPPAPPRRGQDTDVSRDTNPPAPPRRGQDSDASRDTYPPGPPPRRGQDTAPGRDTFAPETPPPGRGGRAGGMGGEATAPGTFPPGPRAGESRGPTALPPPPAGFQMENSPHEDTDPSPSRRGPGGGPSPLPPIPADAGLGGPRASRPPISAHGVSLQTPDDDLSLGDESEAYSSPPMRSPAPAAAGFRPAGARPTIPADAVEELRTAMEERLPALVRQAVEEYCERHFKSLAREIIATELRRLADEKARHLVDN